MYLTSKTQGDGSTTPPENFPNGNSPTASTSNRSTSAEGYASRINTELRTTASGLFKVAAIIDEAKHDLDQTECISLASMVGLSPATLSKYQTIHSRRIRFAHRIDITPASWTVVYELSRLSDADFDTLIQSNKLRRDLTANELSSFLAQIARPDVHLPLQGEANDTADFNDSTSEVLRTFAVIKISPDLPIGIIDEIKTLLAQLLQDRPAQIEFPISKSAAHEQRCALALKDFEARLATLLTEQNTASGSFGEDQYKLYESAALQHRQKERNDEYPYSPDDVRSVECLKHPYSIQGPLSTPKLFFKHLRATKILTVYTPAGDFPANSELRCLKLAIEYCDAKTPKAKSQSKKELSRIAERATLNGDVAAGLLRIIGREGT